MKKSTLVALLVIAGVLIFVFAKELFREKMDGGPIDHCILCHQPQEDPSPSHPLQCSDVPSVIWATHLPEKKTGPTWGWS